MVAKFGANIGYGRRPLLRLRRSWRFGSILIAASAMFSWTASWCC